MTYQTGIDPYAAPKAPVVTPQAPTTPEAFPRFSAWGVFGLAVVTLNIYCLYWLYSRTKILNRILPSNPIPMGLAVAALLLFAANMIGAVVEQVYPDQAGVQAITTLVNLAAGIVNLVWIFKFRNRLNELVGAVASGDPLWAGGVLTFFFQVLYLQYKINQQIDAQTAANTSDTQASDLAGERA